MEFSEFKLVAVTEYLVEFANNIVTFNLEGLTATDYYQAAFQSIDAGQLYMGQLYVHGNTVVVSTDTIRLEFSKSLIKDAFNQAYTMLADSELKT